MTKNMTSTPFSDIHLVGIICNNKITQNCYIYIVISCTCNIKSPEDLFKFDKNYVLWLLIIKYSIEKNEEATHGVV